MKISVAMSGGVDSSFTAMKFIELGYEVVGITMLNTSKLDLENIKLICKELNIEHYFIDVRKKFEKKVLNYFLSEYYKGKTPNPCVVCNKNVKFESIIAFSKKIGIDKIATGHYVRKKNNLLQAGIDKKKDQSYFLSQLDKKYLKNIEFLLGNYYKEDIKKEVKKYSFFKFINSKESQNICFDVEFKNEKGDILNENNEKIGEHNGIHNYTIGQRRNIKISNNFPYYVLKLNPCRNEIIVGEKDKLKKNSLFCSRLNLFVKNLDKKEVLIKIRASCTMIKGKLNLLDKDKMMIEFEDYVYSVTPGQIVVFYNEDLCVLGSGYID